MTPLQWVSVELLVILFWCAVAYLCRKKPIIQKNIIIPHIHFAAPNKPIEPVETRLQDSRIRNLITQLKLLRICRQKRDEKGQYAK